MPAPLHIGISGTPASNLPQGDHACHQSYSMGCLHLVMRVTRQGAHVGACRFSASGKPCVSLGGAPSSVPSKKHAAPLAPPAVPRDTRKSAREAPRKFVGSEAEAKPKPVEAEQGKEPAKKKVHTSCPIRQLNHSYFSLTPLAHGGSG